VFGGNPVDCTDRRSHNGTDEGADGGGSDNCGYGRRDGGGERAGISRRG
jgi:hypothetical protein